MKMDGHVSPLKVFRPGYNYIYVHFVTTSLLTVLKWYYVVCKKVYKKLLLCKLDYQGGRGVSPPPHTPMLATGPT